MGKVKNLLNSDRTLSVRMISEHLNWLQTTVGETVTDYLETRKLYA